MEKRRKYDISAIPRSSFIVPEYVICSFIQALCERFPAAAVRLREQPLLSSLPPSPSRPYTKVQQQTTRLT